MIWLLTTWGSFVFTSVTEFFSPDKKSPVNYIEIDRESHLWITWFCQDIIIFDLRTCIAEKRFHLYWKDYSVGKSGRTSTVIFFSKILITALINLRNDFFRRFFQKNLVPNQQKRGLVRENVPPFGERGEFYFNNPFWCSETTRFSGTKQCFKSLFCSKVILKKFCTR